MRPHLAFAFALLAAAASPVAAQDLAPPGSTNQLKIWSDALSLRGEEAWLVERWGTDTLVVRLRSLNGRFVGEGSETLVLPLRSVERLQVFGPVAQPRRALTYTLLGLLAGAAVIHYSGEQNEFRQSQLAGGVAFAGLFFVVGAQQNDRRFGWLDVPVGRQAATRAAPPAAPDR